MIQVGFRCRTPVLYDKIISHVAKRRSEWLALAYYQEVILFETVGHRMDTISIGLNTYTVITEMAPLSRQA